MDGTGVVREVRSGALVTAAATGLVAAIVGGVVWGLIEKWTNYEVGIVAWAIGFVVGTAVFVGGGRVRGVDRAAVAIVAALLGILIGKYLSFVWGVNDAASSRGLPVHLSVFSSGTLRAFWDDKGDVWSFWDVIWVGLAVVTAFRLTSPATAPRQTAEEKEQPAR